MWAAAFVSPCDTSDTIGSIDPVGLVMPDN
jgi:hypothetical protein